MKTTAVRLQAGARERILLTAHDLFYRDGIRATGVDRLIAKSGVTKTTFYRHFPSKNDLVLAFLEHRHRHWIAWFRTALHERGEGLDSLAPTLREWFQSDDFRGCAFINSVGELSGTIPEVAGLTRRHKQEMKAVIADLLPAGDGAAERAKLASAIALIVDGAIVKAQVDGTSDEALRSLRWILKSLR